VECTDLIDRVTSKPLRWTADTLAWRIGLNDATRTLLKITTIGAIDLNKVQRAERRKQRDAAAHRARRAAVVSVSDYEEKPWEAQGISRATWYRRGKPTAPASLRQNASTADTTAYAVDRNRLTTGSAPQRSASNAAGAAKPGFNFHITGRLRLASLAVLLPAVKLKRLNRPATLGSAPMARLGAQSGAGSAP
jgi:hypothetical protein